MTKKYIYQWILIAIFLTGCQKNLTKDFPDADAPGLSVFSDRRNNTLSCYINGEPWKTVDRIFYARFSGPVGTDYELHINKTRYGTLKDTILFVWRGHFLDNKPNGYNLRLTLSVKKDFNQKDFSALQDQRIIIDSTINGYFSTDANGTNILSKGNGNIYFHKASFDSTGYMSGLFEATVNGQQITKGRFDEALTVENVNFD